MKVKFMLIAILATSIASAKSGDEMKTVEDAVKRLSVYKVADIDGDAKRLASKQKLKIDEMFEDLEAANKFVRAKGLTEDLAEEMARVTVLTFLHDPTSYGADLILESFDRDPKLFKKGANRLHEYDTNILLQVLEVKSENKDGEH